MCPPLRHRLVPPQHWQYLDDSRVAPQPPRPTLLRIAKCASCGSSEFREHRGQTLCSYCRSAA